MTSVQVPDIMQRARHMARRLLADNGNTTVTAYRINPSAPATFVAHVLRANGRILVAVCPPQDTPLAIAPGDVVVDIRLDITLDAAEPGMRITAATAHLLGNLTWVKDEGRTLLLASSRASACHCAIIGEGPLKRVREITAGPGDRLDVITCERIMFHCVSGVSSHNIEEILDIDSADAAAVPSVSWSPQGIMDAREAVNAIGQLGLRAVCETVHEGQMPEWICSSHPAVGVCPTLWDRTPCVDVDARGVTLMSITGEEVITLVVSFGQALADAGEAGPALKKLASHALPRYLTRPWGCQLSHGYDQPAANTEAGDTTIWWHPPLAPSRSGWRAFRSADLVGHTGGGVTPDSRGLSRTHEVPVVDALETLAGTHVTLCHRQAATGVEADEGVAGRCAVVTPDGDGEGDAAAVVEGVGGGGAGGGLGDGRDTFPLERICAANMNNVNPHPLPSNEGQPALPPSVSKNIEVAPL